VRASCRRESFIFSIFGDDLSTARRLFVSKNSNMKLSLLYEAVAPAVSTAAVNSITRHVASLLYRSLESGESQKMILPLPYETITGGAVESECSIRVEWTPDLDFLARGGVDAPGIPGRIIIYGTAYDNGSIHLTISHAQDATAQEFFGGTQLRPELARGIISVIDHEVGHNQRGTVGENHRLRVGAPFGLSDEDWSEEIDEPYKTHNRIASYQYPFLLPDEWDANTHAIVAGISRLSPEQRQGLTLASAVAHFAPGMAKMVGSSTKWRNRLRHRLAREGVVLREGAELSRT
jgi:hypothetical protein